MKNFNLLLLALAAALAALFTAGYGVHRAGNALVNSAVETYYAAKLQHNPLNKMPGPLLYSRVRYQLLTDYSSLYYTPADMEKDPRDRILLAGPSNLGSSLWLDAGERLPPRYSLHTASVGGFHINEMSAMLDIYGRYHNFFGRRNVVVLGLSFFCFQESPSDTRTGIFNDVISRAKIYSRAEDGTYRRRPFYALNMMTNEIRMFYLGAYFHLRNLVIKSSESAFGKKMSFDELLENSKKMYAALNDPAPREANWRALGELATRLRAEGQKVIVIAIPMRAAVNRFPLQEQFKQRIKTAAGAYGFDYVDLSGFLREDEFYSDSLVYYNYTGRVRLTDRFIEMEAKDYGGDLFGPQRGF